MSLRIALKRLSAVEIDPERSNQHEFHASRLRQELELPATRITGMLSCLIFGADDTAPALDEAAFTLYDAREGNVTRSSEWHLYYYSRLIPELSRPGDLLVLYRHEGGLRAVVARAGSKVESDILEVLRLGDSAIRQQFSFLDAPTPDDREAREVASQLTLTLESPPPYQVSEHALFGRAIREGAVPTSHEMAVAAVEIVARRGGIPTDPDGYLSAALTAETDLYYGIESEVHLARLSELLAKAPSVTDVIDFAMTVQQARRSRRGQSLQNHFAAVLDLEQIPHTAQCATETGETPDFIVPGCRQYHDETFSAGSLRMVACKSTARDRWRQVLNEAARIPKKYLLTLDPELTSATIDAMDMAGIKAFVPRSILTESYHNHPKLSALGSVRGLLEELRAVL